MSKQMVFILGFGRSGTTWISDIISKSLGGLILFEPLHPQVLPDALKYCYYDGKDESKNIEIKKYLDETLAGNFSHRWMIRNHLPTPLESPTDWYVEQILKNCSIRGFKAIRGNFLIDFLLSNYPSAHILFIKRNPFAVLASIKKRLRFWEEYGIKNHIKHFSLTVSNSGYLTSLEKEQFQKLISTHKSHLNLSTILWIYTHKMVDRNLENHNITSISYEDIYFSPYKNIKKIISNIGGDPAKMHPSYIFTPSMLTLKTRHSFMDRSINIEEEYNDFFWRKNLDDIEIKQIEKLFDLSEYAIL